MIVSRQVFFEFLRLGLTGFGGPLALVAEMKRIWVEEEKRISEAEFQAAFALVKSMPGPLAYQMALFLARRQVGRWGALLAGFGLLLPALVGVGIFSAYYENIRSIEILSQLLAGLQIGALILIAAAARTLSKPFQNSGAFWLLTLISGFILFRFHAPEALMIFLMGLLWVGVRRIPSPTQLRETISVLLMLFWICFHAGAFVFGTGLAILPLLERDFVFDHHWMTQQQFLDGISIGQLTPGPVSVSVTFFGFLVAGWWGALVATVAIFLPATFHHLTWFPWALEKFHKQSWVDDFLLGATAVIFAAILISIWGLAQAWSPAVWVGAFALLLISVWRNWPSWLVLVLTGAGYLFVNNSR